MSERTYEHRKQKDKVLQSKSGAKCCFTQNLHQANFHDLVWSERTWLPHAVKQVVMLVTLHMAEINCVVAANCQIKLSGSKLSRWTWSYIGIFKMHIFKIFNKNMICDHRFKDAVKSFRKSEAREEKTQTMVDMKLMTCSVCFSLRSGR